MCKVLTAGERSCGFCVNCNHPSTSRNCTISSWSNLSYGKESQRVRLKLSCTILGLVAELFSLFFLLLIENKQKTKRGGGVQQEFFVSGRRFIANGLSTSRKAVDL